MDYSDVGAGSSWSDYTAAAQYLVQRLPDLWIEEYYASCRHEPNILQVSIDGFEHLFDFTSDPAVEPENPTDVPEDRLVVVYGFATRPKTPRDTSRMRGFLGEGFVGEDKGPRDKGHFIAHAAGGGLDINLFPQRPELNRGRSGQGKVFRKMERYAAARPGTFVFARPIYFGAGWTPVQLEYGVLLAEMKLWVERFDN